MYEYSTSRKRQNETSSPSSPGKIIVTSRDASAKVCDKQVTTPPLRASGKVWTDTFSGLWQNEHWNFQREKAFNLAISDDSTKCCVCSMFESPSPFHLLKPELMSEIYQDLHRDKHVHVGGSSRESSREKQFSSLHKPVTELRVVVQRVLIDLPETSKGTADLNCDVTDSDEELISCSSCGICVHRCE